VSAASTTVGNVNITGFARTSDSSDTAQPPALDPSQRAVLGLAEDACAAVLGAPGSGKTTTLIELVAHRVHVGGFSPDEVVALTASRSSATRLRDAIALRLGVATNGPLARTVNSLAHEIVGAAARAAGAAPPRLVTGGEQDADIAQLLEGHAEEGTGPHWPDMLGPDVRRLRGFRSELRELMMRATEYDVPPERLHSLGRQFDRPEWMAAADFIREYRDVVANYRGDQLDSSELAEYAVAAVRGSELSERVARLRLVVVDDLQELTESSLSLLRALAARGIAIVAFGDPDVAANAFRGGEPDSLGRLSSVLSTTRRPIVAQTLVLQTAYRHGPRLRQLVSAVTARIGTAAAGAQRSAPAGSVDDSERPPVVTLSASTPARQWAAIARHLREQHLIGAVPWNRMAVVVRSGAQISGIRRSLSLSEVPARTVVGATALRDDRAARALLTLVDVGTGRTALTAEIATDLLLGPFGGLDRLMLRRLRLALRGEELGGGNTRSSDDLLVEALGSPGRLSKIDHRVGRSADRLATTLAELGTLAQNNGTIEELLWLAWERSGLAKAWFDQALSAGITAAEANTNLDGVVALFTAAKRFVERQPGTPAGVFLTAVLDAEVPEDTLSPQTNDQAVLVTTAPGTVGLEFDVVVVANLQEGVWPNLRLRGSLLGPQELVRVVTGIDSASIDERRLVLGDELRMFALAVSRARRQVVLSTVASEDDAPSVFLSLVPPETPAIDTTSVPPLSLRGLTGRLRRDLVQQGRSASDRAAAASALARLAAERVPGADPADWHGLLEPSTTEPMFADDEQVPVSPSRLERFEESPLDWFIETIAGSEANTAMGLGTILHWAMETATDPAVDAIWDAVEARWAELPFESDWMAAAQRRTARLLVAGIAEYLTDFARDGKTLVGAEKRFSLEIGRAVVNGSIDRVERATDGSVLIVDLKTGNPITQAEKITAHPQLGAYQLAYAQGVLNEYLDELGEHHAGGAKLLYVKKPHRSKLYREAVQPPLDDEALEGFRTRIRQAAAGMAAAEYSGALELSTWGAGGTSNLTIHRVRAVSSD
jgi:superfamily I DNA/RNA helicase/RecB family exonuclease